MNCARCNTTNPDGTRFCMSCGADLTAPPPPNAPRFTGGAPVETKNSAMAITALVLGIMAPLTCGITFLPAIIIAIIALVQINGSQGRLKGHGMAIAGLVIPVLTIPVTAAVLFPVFAKGRVLTHTTHCVSHVRQQTLALQMYYEDHNQYPSAEKIWSDVKIAPKMLHCPSASRDTKNSYGFVTRMGGANIETMKLTPDKQPLVADSAASDNLIRTSTDIAARHNMSKTKQQGAVVGFVDGHSELLPPAQVNGLQ